MTTLDEKKLRQAQNRQMADAIETQGILGFEGFSLRFINVSHVHKVLIPSIYIETLKVLVQDLREEADGLESTIQSEQTIYDQKLADADAALVKGDKIAAYTLYKEAQAMQFDEFIHRLSENLLQVQIKVIEATQAEKLNSVNS